MKEEKHPKEQKVRLPSFLTDQEFTSQPATLYHHFQIFFFRSVHIFQMSNSCRGYRKQMLHIWLSCETLHLRWASNKLLGLMPQIKSTLWTCSGRRIKRANGGMCGELRQTPESLTNHFSQIWLKKQKKKKKHTTTLVAFNKNTS